MKFTAKQIADLLHGEVVGDPEVSVSTLTKIEEGTPGALSFLANPKYTQYIYHTLSSIVLVNRDFVPESPVPCTLIKVDDAYACIAMLLNMVEKSKKAKKGIENNSFIAASATVPASCYVGGFAYISDHAVVGEDTQIYPQVFIGENVTIGADTIIYPGVKIYHDCVIGSRCILHAGVVIGSDGFGFAPQGESYTKIAQIGNVVVEDDVEIGANTTIDRATMGSTYIRRGVKLDNQIQIGHNVEVNSNTVIAAGTGIAGSTKIGKNCVIAGQVGIVGHINIGDNNVLGAKAGITNNTKDNDKLVGYPAVSFSEFARNRAYLRRFPSLMADVDQLKKEINTLKSGQ